MYLHLLHPGTEKALYNDQGLNHCSIPFTQDQGHVYKYAILPTQQMEQTLARLQSSYTRTDGKCVALYYWGKGGGRLRLKVRGEDRVEHILVDTGRTEIQRVDTEVSQPTLH